MQFVYGANREFDSSVVDAINKKIPNTDKCMGKLPRWVTQALEHLLCNQLPILTPYRSFCKIEKVP
jgi:hypothetical protein